MRLEDLLAQEAAVGRLDSSGEFGLDLERSRRKLRDYQLADPGFYLVKLVQAAVAAGARQAAIRTQRGRVAMDFTVTGATNPVSVVQVAQALAARPCERAARHAGVGLNAVCEAAGLVEWTVHSPGLSRRLRVTPEAVDVDEIDPPAEPPQGHQITVRIHKNSLWLPASLAAERKAVVSRCRFAPMALDLDGVAVESALPLGEPVAWHRKVTLPFAVAARYEAGRGLWVRAPRLESGRILSPCLSRPRPGVGGEPDSAALSELPEGLPGEGRHLECGACYTLSINLEERARILPVVDGALLDEEVIAEGLPGLIAVVAAGDVKLDLSEFKAIHDGRWLAHLDRAWQVGNDLGHLALDHLWGICGYRHSRWRALSDKFVDSMGPLSMLARPVLRFSRMLSDTELDWRLRRLLGNRLRSLLQDRPR